MFLALQLGAAYANKYGLIHKVHIGPTACLVVTDPEEVAKLISSRNRTANLPKLAEAYRILEAVGINAAPCVCSDSVIAQGVNGNTMSRNYMVGQYLTSMHMYVTDTQHACRGHHATHCLERQTHKNGRAFAKH